MADYLKKLCLGLSVLLLGCWSLAAQGPLGPEDVRERNPVITAAGDVLYFTRPDYTWNQGAENRGDIWLRHRDQNGRWQRAINPGSPVNSFGHDQLIGVSADGNRLTVLRSGSVRAIDLLQRSGRNWRVVESWPLPPDVQEPDNVTFNTNSLSLVYSAPSRDGQSLDLYYRYAGPAGTWLPATPFSRLNSESDETAPRFAGDGRTLLFRRADQWFRQTDRGKAAQRTDIPARYLALAACTSDVVGMTGVSGQGEQIVPLKLDGQTIVPPARLHFASLGDPPAPGEQTVEVPLSSGVRLRIYPDFLGRYALMLREGEIDFPKSNVPRIDQVRPPGSLASINALPARDRRAYLRQSLARQQRELARLDALRKELSYTSTDQRDAEWTSLRNRLRRPNETQGDTVPLPVGASPSDSTRLRYASDLDELERMKEKFRKQQQNRLRDRDEAASVPFVVGESSKDNDPLTNAVDTSQLRANVRTGLYSPMPTRLSEHQKWENQIRNDLPQTDPLTPTEAARLDAAYARQMQEIQALRSQLREVEGMDDQLVVGDSSIAGNQFTQRSVAPVGISPGATGAGDLSLTFVPNTAYLDSGGYAGVDQLVTLIRAATSTVEIRVYTDAILDSRAAQRLSEERAATIEEQLVSLGVSADNFRVIGYGNHLSERGEGIEVIR